jgi:hypothetical protein
MNARRACYLALQVDHAKFPLFRYARGYECELIEGEAVYLPPMCWHSMECLTPSIAMTSAFYSSRTHMRHGAVASWRHRHVDERLPHALKMLLLLLAYPGCGTDLLECRDLTAVSRTNAREGL